jgi:hypothetical protein
MQIDNIPGQERLAAQAGHLPEMTDGMHPISIRGAVGMAAAIGASLLLMSVPAQGGEAIQLAAALVPAHSSSLSQFTAAVPKAAPRDRCWYGPCREAEDGSDLAHFLRPATPFELHTKRLQHATPPPNRLRKVGEKHLGLRILQSIYAVVGMPSPAFDPSARARPATDRIDVGLRFVRKF